MKKFAVLMTCYNRVGTTLGCLRRLFGQNVPAGWSFDVWLVDDNSPDGTGTLVKESFPQVNVIKGTGNLFWCKGMRLAWEGAAQAFDYDGYLWLNDDVMLHEGFLEHLAKDVGFVEDGGCEAYVLVGACEWSAGGGLAYGCYKERNSEVLVPQGVPVDADKTYSMSGNVVFVSQGAFRKLGFIHGSYGHAYGDSDYRQMMLKKGVPMYCASVVAGVCPKEPERYLKPENEGLAGRVKLLFSPKGRPLHDVFLYRYRNWGLPRALLSVAHVTLITLFPKKH